MAIAETPNFEHPPALPSTGDGLRLDACRPKARSTAKSNVWISFHQPWDPKSSIRQKELAQAAQRSHSARVVNERRRREKLRQTEAPDRTDSIETTISAPLFPKVYGDPDSSIRVIVSEEEDEDKVAVDSSSPQFFLVAKSSRLPTLTRTSGNSDPFSSYVIEVNPQVNRMIAFARQSFFPSMSTPPWLRKQGRTPEETLRFFELGRGTPDSTVAHLTCYGAVLLRILPNSSKHEFEKAWLQVRSQALQNLRRSLPQSGNDPLAISVIQQCLYLFQADIEVRFFSTAKIHARTLRYLFEPLPPSTTTVLLFLTAMHSTLETACLSLDVPIMTFDNWNPLVWHSIWASAESTLTAFVPETARELHPSIRYPFLRQTLHRLRLYFAMPALSRSLVSRAENDNAMLWSVTRPVDDAVKLIARFLELNKSYSIQSYPKTRMHQVDSLWEMTSTLTAFSAIRHHAHSPFLDDTNIDLRDESSVIAPQLRRSTERLLSALSEKETSESSDLLFWVYFIGAVFEQRKSPYRSQILGEIGITASAVQGVCWFTQRLAEQARLLDLMTWRDARPLLDQFAAYGEEILEPDPSGWYDQIFDENTWGY